MSAAISYLDRSETPSIVMMDVRCSLSVNEKDRELIFVPHHPDAPNLVPAGELLSTLRKRALEYADSDFSLVLRDESSHTSIDGTQAAALTMIGLSELMKEGNFVSLIYEVERHGHTVRRPLMRAQTVATEKDFQEMALFEKELVRGSSRQVQRG